MFVLGRSSRKRKGLLIRPETRYRRVDMGGRLVIVGALAAALTAAACGSPASTPSAVAQVYQISGILSLIDFTSASAGCVGQGGYSDIAPGTQVQVTNQSGAIIGTGTLGSVTASGDGTTCAFPFIVMGLPRATFYGIQVSHRGQQDYSFSQLQADIWRVSLQLGG